MISFEEAYRLTVDAVEALGPESIPLLEATGRAAAHKLKARVSSPSVDVSLKDGFAVRPQDVWGASPEHEIHLDLIGDIAAGGTWKGSIGQGQTVRILSGAPIPDGADAVLAEEFAREGKGVTAFNDAGPGRNVLRRGEDIRKGQLLVDGGEILSPPKIGCLASAGYAEVPVTRVPRVGIIATGDEVVAPGKPLETGKLYASNLVTLASWCKKYGFNVETMVLPDRETEIREGLQRALRRNDVVLTSGGAWKGERDLVVDVLQRMGWKHIYHRVRMGPGKAVGFGMAGMKPVFCLPGGPPSNYMAFLQLALPGLKKMAGFRDLVFPKVPVALSKAVEGQIDWTQFVCGRLDRIKDKAAFVPVKPESRLQMMAASEAIIKIPEGENRYQKGEWVEAYQLF